MSHWIPAGPLKTSADRDQREQEKDELTSEPDGGCIDHREQDSDNQADESCEVSAELRDSWDKTPELESEHVTPLCIRWTAIVATKLEERVGCGLNKIPSLI